MEPTRGGAAARYELHSGAPAPGEARPTIVGGGCDIEKKQSARTQPYRADEPFTVENARPLGYDP